MAPYALEQTLEERLDEVIQEMNDRMKKDDLVIECDAEWLLELCADVRDRISNG